MNDIFLPVVESDIPRWMVMWGLAGVLFAVSKMVTLMEVRRARPGIRARWVLVYSFLWVGMDGRGFFGAGKPVEKMRMAPGLAKTFFGCLLLWGAAPLFNGLVAGWIGMIGMVLMLHFGLFHLLAAFWRTQGVGAEPIMNRPLCARTLSEFWGERWNRAYNELMHRFIFRRTVGWAGAAGATMLVFVISGLIHDLVISVPAQGGYGLPTIYFVIQGIGLMLQRTQTA
ncbi:MAG: MBOAT family protein, partial [Limisphaerales bacterium]